MWGRPGGVQAEAEGSFGTEGQVFPHCWGLDELGLCAGASSFL